MELWVRAHDVAWGRVVAAGTSRGQAISALHAGHRENCFLAACASGRGCLARREGGVPAELAWSERSRAKTNGPAASGRTAGIKRRALNGGSGGYCGDARCTVVLQPEFPVPGE